MKRKKDDSGRKRESYGYQIITSELAPGNWLVHIYTRRPGDGPPERDGFLYEGLALDWAEDWCHEHRALSYKIKSRERGDGEDGYVAYILDHAGSEIGRTPAQATHPAAEHQAERYIAAIRKHDLEVARERAKNRANFRMEMRDLDEREAYFNDQIQTAKDAVKKIDATRAALKAGLHAPQVEFSFVAGGSAREDLEQLDVEEYAGRRREPRKTLSAVKGGASTEAPTS